MNNFIPPMTDSVSKFWNQPKADELIIADNTAHMTQDQFNKLINYSSTVPSGTYAGKMWKSETTDGWFLHWYGLPYGESIPIFSLKIKVTE